MGLQERFRKPDALWFGIGVHFALAKWYRKGKRRGPHPARTFADWCGEEVDYIRAAHGSDAEWYDEPLYEDFRSLGIAMLEGYIEKYGRDPNWDVIFVEHPFKVRILDKNGKPVALFASTFDGVYRDLEDGLIYLMEHKTATQVVTAHLPWDDQAGAYFAVASAVLRDRGVLKPGEKIEGITYNILRKSMPDDRPVNEDGLSLNQNGTVSKRQPAARFIREFVDRSEKDNRAQLLRIAEEQELMDALRDGTIPITKSRTRDCPYCPFSNMCLLHDRGGNAWKKFAGAEFVVGDPNARVDHFKSASE